MAGAGHRPPGVLEREVLAALAVAERPLTSAEVIEELQTTLAYTTVVTTLNRLCAKGALERSETDSRAYAYALSGPVDEIPAALTARQMSLLLDAGSDRAAALARFVAELRPEDERELARLLGSPGRRRGRSS